jgi:hypothetical protein
VTAGNVTLLEAAKGNQTDLKAGVIETIIQESPIINKIPWMPINGFALQHTVEDTLPQAEFRNVNEGYNKSWGTDTTHYWGTAIFGGEIVVDNYLVKTRGNVVKVKAKQFAKMAKSSAMRFEYEFWNGTGANKGFKGVKTLINEGFGQSMTNNAAGATLSLDKLDQAHDLFRNQGGADEILLNRLTRRELTSAARSTVTGVSLIDVGTDVFGKQVMSWNGVPLTIMGDVQDSSGVIAAALPYAEDNTTGMTTGSSCSLYLVKWGEDDVCGLLGADGDFDVRDFGEQQASPSHLGRLEWYPGIAIFNKYSIVRLFGIT